MKFLASFLVLVALALPAMAQDVPTTVAKINRLLDSNKVEYQTKPLPNQGMSWAVKYQGQKSEQGFLLILAVDNTNPSQATAFITVAPKGALPTDADFLRKLLNANNDYDVVKVGHDSDGDLFVRADILVRTMDAPALAEIMKQIYRFVSDAVDTKNLGTAEGTVGMFSAELHWHAT
jgi:hypothetical protein